MARFKKYVRSKAVTGSIHGIATSHVWYGMVRAQQKLAAKSCRTFKIKYTTSKI